MTPQTEIRSYSENTELVADRRRLITIAAARFLGKRGYDRTSMREIAKACGIAQGTIYHYIGSKRDILDLVLTYGKAHYEDFFERAGSYLQTLTPTEALKRTVEDFYRKLDERQDFALLAFQEAKNFSRSQLSNLLQWDESVMAVFERILAKGCALGEFTIDDMKLVANRIVADGEMWPVRRWFLKRHYTLEEYIDKEIQFILRAISQDKGMCNEG